MSPNEKLAILNAALVALEVAREEWEKKRVDVLEAHGAFKRAKKELEEIEMGIRTGTLQPRLPGMTPEPAEVATSSAIAAKATFQDPHPAQKKKQRRSVEIGAST